MRCEQCRIFPGEGFRNPAQHLQNPGQRLHLNTAEPVYRRIMGKAGRQGGPSRAWFVLPCSLMLAALLLVGFGISSFLHFVRSDFVAYQPDSSISVGADGFTLYAEDGTTGAADLHGDRPGQGGTAPTHRGANHPEQRPRYVRSHCLDPARSPGGPIPHLVCE
jgi:hypothetical protein